MPKKFFSILRNLNLSITYKIKMVDLKKGQKQGNLKLLTLHWKDTKLGRKLACLLLLMT